MSPRLLSGTFQFLLLSFPQIHAALSFLAPSFSFRFVFQFPPPVAGSPFATAASPAVPPCASNEGRRGGGEDTSSSRDGGGLSSASILSLSSAARRRPGEGESFSLTEREGGPGPQHVGGGSESGCSGVCAVRSSSCFVKLSEKDILSLKRRGRHHGEEFEDDVGLSRSSVGSAPRSSSSSPFCPPVVGTKSAMRVQTYPCRPVSVSTAVKVEEGESLRTQYRNKSGVREEERTDCREQGEGGRDGEVLPCTQREFACKRDSVVCSSSSTSPSSSLPGATPSSTSPLSAVPATFSSSPLPPSSSSSLAASPAPFSASPAPVMTCSHHYSAPPESVVGCMGRVVMRGVGRLSLMCYNPVENRMLDELCLPDTTDLEVYGLHFDEQESVMAYMRSRHRPSALPPATPPSPSPPPPPSSPSLNSLESTVAPSLPSSSSFSPGPLPEVDRQQKALPRSSEQQSERRLLLSPAHRERDETLKPPSDHQAAGPSSALSSVFRLTGGFVKVSGDVEKEDAKHRGCEGTSSLPSLQEKNAEGTGLPDTSPALQSPRHTARDGPESAGLSKRSSRRPGQNDDSKKLVGKERVTERGQGKEGTSAVGCPSSCSFSSPSASSSSSAFNHQHPRRYRNSLCLLQPLSGALPSLKTLCIKNHDFDMLEIALLSSFFSSKISSLQLQAHILKFTPQTDRLVSVLQQHQNSASRISSLLLSMRVDSPFQVQSSNNLLRLLQLLPGLKEARVQLNRHTPSVLVWSGRQKGVVGTTEQDLINAKIRALKQLVPVNPPAPSVLSASGQNPPGTSPGIAVQGGGSAPSPSACLDATSERKASMGRGREGLGGRLQWREVKRRDFDVCQRRGLRSTSSAVDGTCEEKNRMNGGSIYAREDQEKRGGKPSTREDGRSARESSVGPCSGPRGEDEQREKTSRLLGREGKRTSSSMQISCVSQGGKQSDGEKSRREEEEEEKELDGRGESGSLVLLVPSRRRSAPPLEREAEKEVGADTHEEAQDGVVRPVRREEFDSVHNKTWQVETDCPVGVRTPAVLSPAEATIDGQSYGKNPGHIILSTTPSFSADERAARGAAEAPTKKKKTECRDAPSIACRQVVKGRKKKDEEEVEEEADDGVASWHRGSRRSEGGGGYCPPYQRRRPNVRRRFSEGAVSDMVREEQENRERIWGGVSGRTISSRSSYSYGGLRPRTVIGSDRWTEEDTRFSSPGTERTREDLALFLQRHGWRRVGSSSSCSSSRCNPRGSGEAGATLAEAIEEEGRRGRKHDEKADDSPCCVCGRGSPRRGEEEGGGASVGGRGGGGGGSRLSGRGCGKGRSIDVVRKGCREVASRVQPEERGGDEEKETRVDPPFYSSCFSWVSASPQEQILPPVVISKQRRSRFFFSTPSSSPSPSCMLICGRCLRKPSFVSSASPNASTTPGGFGDKSLRASCSLFFSSSTMRTDSYSSPPPSASSVRSSSFSSSCGVSSVKPKPSRATTALTRGGECEEGVAGGRGGLGPAPSGTEGGHGGVSPSPSSSACGGGAGGLHKSWLEEVALLHVTLEGCGFSFLCMKEEEGSSSSSSSRVSALQSTTLVYRRET